MLHLARWNIHRGDVVAYVIWVQALNQVLCRQKIWVLLHCQHRDLIVEMIDVWHLVKSCSYSQNFVLRDLNLSDAGDACIGTPDWGTVVCDRPSYCLVGHQYRLLLLSPGSACQGLQVFLLLTLVAACVQCTLKVRDVSRWTLKIFGLRFSGSWEPAILMSGWYLACFVSGVKRVTVDFGADISREFDFKNSDIFSR